MVSQQAHSTIISSCGASPPTADLTIDLSQLERTESAFLACSFGIIGLLVLWRSVQFATPAIVDEVGEKKKRSGWRR